ncbi:hypothetical protein L837_4866 [Mycobacterium avium MAV_061107_1842]|nr:hypothetical protein L837_4866 [Mycobacterium avium MAV_061107_1842]
MQGTLLPGGRFTIFHYGEVLAVRFADPIDAVTVVASVGVRICNLTFITVGDPAVV